MHFSLSALVVLSGFAVQVFGQGPTINSPPQLIQCQPSLLAFDGGVPPYFLSVLPGNQPSAAPILNLPNQPAPGTYTWTPELPAGTLVTLQIRDSAGAIGYSAAVSVLAGTTSVCPAPGVSSGAGAASTGSAAATATTSGSVAASSAASSGVSSTVASSVSTSSVAATAIRSSLSSAVSSVASSVSAAVASRTSSPASAATTSAAPASGASQIVLSGFFALVAGMVTIVV